jgi:hypothetical protein
MVWLLKLIFPLVIEIKAGKVSAAKGRIPSRSLREVQEVIAEAGLVKGAIYADDAGRFHFSGAIPPECHQRLRNTLASLC